VGSIGRLQSICGSGVGEEGLHFGGVFVAGCGFNTTDHVYAPGVESGDGFGYVFGIEAAGGY
jgi:hypothetical protein